MVENNVFIYQNISRINFIRVILLIEVLELYQYNWFYLHGGNLETDDSSKIENRYNCH